MPLSRRDTAGANRYAGKLQALGCHAPTAPSAWRHRPDVADPLASHSLAGVARGIAVSLSAGLASWELSHASPLAYLEGDNQHLRRLQDAIPKTAK